MAKKKAEKKVEAVIPQAPLCVYAAWVADTGEEAGGFWSYYERIEDIPSDECGDVCVYEFNDRGSVSVATTFVPDPSHTPNTKEGA